MHTSNIIGVTLFPSHNTGDAAEDLCCLQGRTNFVSNTSVCSHERNARYEILIAFGLLHVNTNLQPG